MSSLSLSVCLSVSLSLSASIFSKKIFYTILVLCFTHLCPRVYVLHILLTCFFHIVLCYIHMFILFVNLLEQRAPRKIGAKPIGLPSKNKEFTYLLTYRHRRDMTEKLLKATLNPNKQQQHYILKAKLLTLCTYLFLQ